MKKLFFLAFFALLSLVSNAQGTKPSPDATATGSIGGTKITVKYAQPAVKGRNVWAGDLAPYGKVWRTGANAATVIEFDKAVKVEGKDLAAGKYLLFTIPGEKEWTIIFSKYEANAWGAYAYKEANDALRVMAASSANEMTERFTIAVEKTGVSLAWDKAKVVFGVK